MGLSMFWYKICMPGPPGSLRSSPYVLHVALVLADEKGLISIEQR